MSVRVTQLSYNSGVMSGLMQGRADDSKYASAVQVCRNARCTPQGPLENRPGFMYVAETKYPDKKCRIIPFSYSAGDTMVIELGDKYARFHTQGKTLMNKEGTAPYEIETPWAAEDLFQVHYTQNAAVMTLVHPNYPPQELRRYSLNDWRITPVSLVTTLKAPSGVKAVRLTEAANDSNKDKYTQKYVVTSLNEDRTQESKKSEVASCVANLYATGCTVEVSWEAVEGAAFYRVYKLQGGIYGYIGQTQELSIVDDNIAPETGETPPYTDDVFKVAKGIESVEVTNGGSGYEWIRGGIAEDTGGTKWTQNGYARTPRSETKTEDEDAFWSVRITDSGGSGSGGVVKIKTTKKLTQGSFCSGSRSDSSSCAYHAFTEHTYAGYEVVSPGRGYVKPIVRLTACRVAGNAEYIYTSKDPIGNWDFEGEVKTFNGGVELVVEDPTGYGAKLQPRIEGGKIVSVRVVEGGQNYTNPTIRVVASSGSGATFDVKVADTGDYPAAVGYFEQRRIFAGSPLKPQNIWMTATGTEDNMTYHLPLQDDDRISFAVASRDLNRIQHVVALQQLLMLTSAAEWRVSPLNSDAITPTSISVRPQSYVGASSVQPVLANNTAIYAEARGGHVREVAYNYNAGGYVTGDLSIRAEGLFSGKEITDLAYAKTPFSTVWAVSTSGSLLGLTYVPEQQVGAWFEYTTNGDFESATVVQEGSEDVVYVVTFRWGKRFVECTTRRDDADNKSGVYLDCAGVYGGEATDRVTGLTWLAEKEVTVNADGNVITGLKVGKDGSLSLPAKATRIVVGLPYAVEIQTMPIVAQASDGSLAKGHTKNVNRVWLRLKNSAAPEVGPDFDSLAQVKPRTKEPYGKPPELVNGVIEALPPGKWVDDTGVCIRLKKPLPFTLISHSADVELGG